MPRFKLPAALAIFAAAAIFAANGNWPWPRLDVESPTPLATVAGAPVVTHTEIHDTLGRGETLSQVFERNGVEGVDLSALAKAIDARRLRAGLVFKVRRPAAESLPDRITVRTGPERRVLFTRAAAGWNTDVETIEWRPEIVRVAGRIESSLYEALDRDVPDSILPGPERDRLAWELADVVFAWQIDFSRDIQQGDEFQVVVERLVSEEGEVRFGRILASDLELERKHLTAFRFAGNGAPRFYDRDGNSLKRAFLRAPVQFRRISSNFSRARFHPVLGRTRRHEGTDYAASTGTPVMAAGDGTVIRAGRAGGYGNLVEIQHRNGITTRYAHLSRIATRRGVRVSQSQVIGYVGATGLASGPHLHYEYRVGGVAKDSRRVVLGTGAPLERRERPAFEAERDRLAAILYQSPRPAGQLIAATLN